MSRYHVKLFALAALIGLSAVAPPPASAATGMPIDISLKLTMDCITPGNAYLLGDCGDMLKSTYVEETVPKTGPLTVGTTLFRWPAMAVKTNDTMQALGQTFSLPNIRGYSSVALLCTFKGASAKGSVASLLVTYSDGSTDRVSFRARDWKMNPEKSDIKGVRVQTIATPLFTEGSITKALAAINPKKAIRSIQMPQTSSPALFVWAVSLSMEKAPAA